MLELLKIMLITWQDISSSIAPQDSSNKKIMASKEIEEIIPLQEQNKGKTIKELTLSRNPSLKEDSKSGLCLK